MPDMAEKAKQEVGFAKQEVGSYLGNGASQSETDEILDPLGYIISIHMPNMAEKAEQEVGFAKQEVASYLGTVCCRMKRQKIWALWATQ